MMLEKAKKLAEIIIRVKLKKASWEEREILAEWLDEDEGNRQLYKRIVRGHGLARRLQMEEEIAQAMDYEHVRGEILRRMLKTHHRRQRWIAWGGVAAACCVACGVFWQDIFKQEEVKPLAQVETIKAKPQKPKEDKVMLILENGEKVSLIERKQNSIRLPRMTLVNAGERLSYHLERAPLEMKTIYHKMVTAVGGDYQLELSDGTRVWLNAMSEIEYPVRFSGKDRVVRLKGEAYFEVAADAEHPFVVESGRMRTRALGTSFNVCAYENEEEISTTLLDGKVEVSLAKAGAKEMPSMRLIPGMQSTWQKTTGAFTVKQVNARDEVAWRHGVFVFNEDDIEVVTRMLSRWYAVTFVFDKERKERHTFSGRMSKDESLASILKTLTLAGGPRFKIEGNVVHIIE